MKIYLDNNATTPIHNEVSEAMLPYLHEYFGNPSSSHSYGTETKKAIENARKQLANCINCKPCEIIFTSGGTESNNYAIKGYAFENKHKGNHIITSTIEHPAVIEVCKFLEQKGFQVSYIPVDEWGMVKIDELEKAINPQTILISIMHANNEIGTIQPIAEISKIAKKYNIAFHTDAAQTLGKIPVDVEELGIDLLSIAGHKVYAPKGIGALYIKEGLKLEKMIHGADHEQNKRAGTENVLEIVGLGKACEIAQRDLVKNKEHLQKMSDLLYNNLTTHLSNIKSNGHPTLHLPNTLSLSFYKIEANVLLNEMGLKGIAASAGAACHTDSIDISTVLKAIQLDPEFAMGTLRFSMGRYTTSQEIELASQTIIDIVKQLQSENHFIEPQNATKNIKLTVYTQGLGCACKLRPQELEKILKNIPIYNDSNILVDTQNSDDAAVYKINDTTALVQTVDFFTPIVDDPYQFGAIAAANALSDIYAMGAKPLFALNIVGFPSNRLPMEVLNQILIGASDKAKEAGISILGGHTIDDSEPKFGMVVSGTVNPNHIWKNSGAQKNDAIILTKPIGTGILTTAIKREMINDEVKQSVIQSMMLLNKLAAEIISKYPISSCTDVTGFGLVGHLSEISKASHVNVELFADKVPIFDEVENLVSANIIPGGTQNNLIHFSKFVIWDSAISELKKIILCDVQTSGGLLFTLPQSEKENVLNDLKNAGIIAASHIGNCTDTGEGKIGVKKN